MRRVNLPHTNLHSSIIGIGCMRISSLSTDELEHFIEQALRLGINFFDHADIYGNGECERKFGEVLKRRPEFRQQMIIQSKCDIVTAENGGPRYQSDKDYIIAQAKASIERLQCGYLDILLLHRPDLLMDPKEVAEAFHELKKEGLVHYFGVSNFGVARIEMLQKYLEMPLIADQMQFSIVHSSMLDSQIYMNMKEAPALRHDDGILEYCINKDIVMQAWCPLQASWQDGTFLNNPKYEQLNAVLEKLAEKYQCTKAAVAIAWILRIPAPIMPIVGTTSVQHLKEITAAVDIHLDAQEWYDLYCAKGIVLP